MSEVWELGKAVAPKEKNAEFERESLDLQIAAFSLHTAAHSEVSNLSRLPSVDSRFPVPDRVPGELVQDPVRLDQLREHLAQLCNLNSVRFPGSQPVSFDLNSLQLLEQEDFWVCEKSDGVRVLVLIVASDQGQEVYLVDRKEDFYQVFGLTFPHQDGPNYVHSNTVLDGEMVIDVDPQTNEEKLRLLAFDLLVCDSDNLMAKALSSRYGRLKDWIIKPYKNFLEANPAAKEHQPFEVLLKPQELAYGIEAVFRDHVPKLQHGNDGLIFTSAESPYTPGTDYKILKWKPPSENSIDFLLQLKFPASDTNPTEPDFTAKPVFMLMMNHGHEGTHYYDTMEIDDETWETWKLSGEQFDDRVIEVVWDQHKNTWKMLRFRDDKFEGNYKTVVANIIKSIQHGVEAETLVEHAPRIKSAFRQRAAEKKARAQAEMKAYEEEKRRRHQTQSQHTNGSQTAAPRPAGGLKR